MSVTSSTGVKPQPPPKGRLDLSNVDEEFCRLFRCRPGVKSERQLDRLSLLACDRQGIPPADLLPPPPAPEASAGASPSPKSGGKPGREAVDPTVAAAAAKRRSAKIAIVEQERRHLHQVVCSAATADHLSHEQHQLQTDLKDQEAHVGRSKSSSSAAGKSGRPQNADAGATNGTTSHADETTAEDDAPLQCADAEEDEDVAILLEHVPDLGSERARLQRTLDATRRKGEEEVAKLRERQLRQVAHDIEAEAKRRAMLEHIAEREAMFQHQADEKQRSLAEQAAREARAARRKIKALRIRNDAIARHRAAELEDRAAHHDELWHELAAKREAELEQRREETRKKDDIARERAQRVKDSVEKRCELLEHEAVDKIVTHEERRALITTQLAVAREQRRVVSLRKFMAARQYVETRDDGGGAAREQLDSRHSDADARHAQARAASKKRLEEERRRRDEAAALAAKRREDLDEKRARKNILSLRREVEKERDVEAARQRKEAQIARLKALEEMKREHHDDNTARLTRQQAHAQRQKDALLAEAAERDRAQRALKVEMSRKLQAARQRIAEDRERVQEQMGKVRTSRHLLDQSPEELLEASLRRDRPARSRGGSAQPSPVKPSTAATPNKARNNNHHATTSSSQPASSNGGGGAARPETAPASDTDKRKGSTQSASETGEVAARRASTPSSAVEAAASRSSVQSTAS